MTPDPGSLVDIHSHLVPGVDDGARDVGAVLHAVERMTRAGVRRLLTTPHLRGSLTHEGDRLEERLDEVTEAFERARHSVEADFPEVQLERGHEVLVDVPDPDLSDPRVRLAGTSFVLIEWPRLQIPPGTPRVIRQLRDLGYRPVIAHPERYAGLRRSMDLAGRWREEGAYLQVNHGSLVGRYGSEAGATAMELLRSGWVDYLASDFHGHPRMKVYLEEALAVFDERESADVADVLCRINPSRLLDDEEPIPVPGLPPHPSLLGRLKDRLRRESA